MKIKKYLVYSALFFMGTSALMLLAGERYYIGHRGEYMALQPLQQGTGMDGVVDVPEGTRPAYERIRDRKVNAVKLDVQYTSDKVVVMSHDTNLKRTTGSDLPIVKHTYAELKSATFIKKGDYDSEKILTLGEALEIVKDCKLFYLDFKYSTPEMIKDVFAQFRQHNIPVERVVVATFNRQALRDVRLLEPDVRRVLHIGYRKQKDGSFTCGSTKVADFAGVKQHMLELVEEYGLYGFNIPTWSEYTTPAFAAELKAAGVQWLSLWFVHSTANAIKFHDSVIDGYVTGCPSAIKAFADTL